MKVQSGAITPPDTGHVGLEPVQRVVDGPEVWVSVTDVSEACHPEPETVTTVPVGPFVGERVSVAVDPPTTNGGDVAIGAGEASATWMK